MEVVLTCEVDRQYWINRIERRLDTIRWIRDHDNGHFENSWNKCYNLPATKHWLTRWYYAKQAPETPWPTGTVTDGWFCQLYPSERHQHQWDYLMGLIAKIEETPAHQTIILTDKDTDLIGT